MKHILTMALVAMTFIAGLQEGKAQTTYNKEQNNYFVLTRNVPQLKAIILAADQLATDDREKFGEFHVVICGQTVSDLTNLETMQPYLDMAKNKNIKFALKKSETVLRMLQALKTPKYCHPQGHTSVHSQML